jgi:Tol biopolymer transport system component
MYHQEPKYPWSRPARSLSFYPTWSPDGEYIAMYTLHRVANPSGSGAARYNFVAGEYGIVPSARK